jgi:hypothetical protein
LVGREISSPAFHRLGLVEEEDRFGATMPRFLPLLEDDAMVEAHVPFQEWLDAARGPHEGIDLADPTVRVVAAP